jgi:hypothetical protein
MDNFAIKPQSTHAPSTSRKQTTSQSEMTKSRAPSHEDIARRAYDIYEKNNRREGQCWHNWMQAEQELKADHSLSSAEQECRPEESPTQRTDSSPTKKTPGGATPLLLGGIGSVRIVTSSEPPQGTRST